MSGDHESRNPIPGRSGRCLLAVTGRKLAGFSQAGASGGAGKTHHSLAVVRQADTDVDLRTDLEPHPTDG
jgi:hypothetical protein